MVPAYDVRQQWKRLICGSVSSEFSRKVKLLPGRVSSGWGPVVLLLVLVLVLLLLLLLLLHCPLLPPIPDLLDFLLDELDLFGVALLDVLSASINTTAIRTGLREGVGAQNRKIE